MNHTFVIGLIGSLTLVTGAAWPEIKDITHPMRSIKNWLLAIGAFVMFIYALLGFFESGPIFFAFLQGLVIVSSIMMMLNIDDRISSAVVSIIGLTLVGWSLYLFENYNTVFFIIGLVGIGLGYVFKMGTLRRSLALTLGAALIALFSYIEKSWIFFWLNVFFAIFSAYYVIQGLKKKKI